MGGTRRGKALKEERLQSVQLLSCVRLCDPMNRSTPGLPVHHQFPEFTQTHVHRVGDAIQPSHPLSSPSPPAPNPSQHQGLFEDPKPSTTWRPDLDPALHRQSINSYLGNNWKNLNMDEVLDILRNNCVWHNNGGYTKRDQPWDFLEGLMLKLKLQYFGHLMRRVDSLEKSLMLGGMGGRRRRG